MQEIWKDIPKYEGFYQASNWGRVKSLERKVFNGKGFFIKKERILKACNNPEGYPQVQLFLNKCRKTISVHKLVAMTFLGHKPEDGFIVDHKNGIKTDNRASELQLITFRENLSKDKWKKNPSSKYTGVYFCNMRKKWRSRIDANGVTHALGSFNTEIKASQAYQKALKDYEAGRKIDSKKKSKKTSEYTGVCFMKNRQKKWKAQIWLNSKNKHIGSFSTEIEAHNAYQYYLKHGRRKSDTK